MQLLWAMSGETATVLSEFFFDDLFFEIAKGSNEYKTDGAFQFFVDEGESLYNSMDVLLSSWNLGLDIGKLVGNLTVGGENLISRALEMETLYDISLILQNKIYEDVNPYLSYYYENSGDGQGQELADMLNFL